MDNAHIVQEAEKIANPQPQPQPKIVKRVIYGQKVVLFGVEPVDLPHFVRLHREDARGYMQKYCLKNMTEAEAMHFCTMLFATRQVLCWSVYLKQTSIKDLVEDRRAGFIYLTDMTSFSANISGVMDAAVMKGLLKQIRRDKVTFAEDAIKTIIDYCFTELGLRRIDTSVIANNKRALALDRKCGFVEEGRLRQAFHIDDKFLDVVMLSILRDEWGK